MSPILSYHNDERPPPFKQTASAPYQHDNGASSSHDRFPPSYADESLPSSPPSAKQHHKPRNREPNDSRDDRYGGLEAEGGEDEAELLYELDVLEGGVPRGRRDSSGGIMRRPAESTEERRARGEAVISGGSGGRRGWLGAELPNRAAWKEIREMVYETTPTLLFNVLGLVFTGQLLEHLSHWKVFERVDELFILVPMLSNLKGNLEMCLGARLSTSANTGELDARSSRRSLILGSLSLLQLQALVVSFLAGLLSFLLGLAMPHRISDEPILLANGTTLYRYGNITSLSPILHHHPPSPHSRGLSDFFIGERDDPDLGFYDSFKEGYTRPGGKELVMVLVTGMLAASVSGAVLGSFVSALVVLSRRLRINPDNITTPLAACLSDLVTLFCLGLIGSFLVPYIDTALPIVTLPCLVLVGAVFTWYTLRNDYVKDQIRSGWTPLFAAMTISSAVGVVLERCVSRYEGYAILAVAMTGLSGAVGSIHASRLSTVLHSSDVSSSYPSHPSPNSPTSPRTMSIALFAVSIPVQLFFLIFVAFAGWMRMEWQLVSSFVAVFGVTVFISLLVADRLVLFFWSRGMDPDSYVLPIQSSLIDLVGQVLLVAAFEVAAMLGGNVRVLDP